MTFPFGQPITLIKRTKGVRDSFGNDTWTTTSTQVTGAFDPGTSTEQVQGQDVVTMQPRVFLPAAVDVAVIDAIQVGGQIFEVDGAPNHWTSPLTGWSPGIEVRLKRVTG